MPVLLRAASLLAVLFLWALPALGQATPTVSAPVAQGSTDVPYPPGAQGNATVALELTVEKDGHVSDAVVSEGVEPFAEQARRAVLSWLFLPARRGDTAIRARIRARVDFQADAAAAASPVESLPGVPAAPASVAPRGPAVPETPVEITVIGTRHEIGQTTLSASDVREMPGAFGDGFRAIEALPGVVPILSGLPYFYIRGAPPNDNGFFIDGIRVPLLFHVAVGQSVIHPGLVDRVDLYPSAPPARYGGYVGAIIAGQTREPSLIPRGEVNLRLFDAGTLLETPFGEGRGSALVAGRYGYPGPVLGALSPDLKLGYWDYQARVSWKVTERDTLSVFAFGSHDFLATREARSNEFREQFVSDFHRLDLRYDHVFTDGQLRAAVTLGADSQGAFPSYLRDRSLAVRVHFEHQLAAALRLRAGAESHLDAYEFQQQATDAETAVVPSSVDPPPTNLDLSGYADLVWHMARRVEVVPGARVAAFSSSRAIEPGNANRVRTTLVVVDPRLATRVTLSPAVAWLASFGLSHQYPTLRVGSVPAAVVTGAGFPLGTRQLQVAAQLSQGVEVALPAELTLTVASFYTHFSGLTDLTAECIQLTPGLSTPMPSDQQRPDPYVCPNNAAVQGRAYGVELLLRRALNKRLTGWFSYTLSRSTREAHFVTPTGGDTVSTVPSEGDRRHVLNAVVAYDLGRRWRAGSRFAFFTGRPYSNLNGNIPIPPFNGQRYPAFYRVDVRLEKRWPLADHGFISFVLEGLNVTLNKEWGAVDCRGDYTPQASTLDCRPAKMGPIALPSIGVEASF
jgi:TonB family protein